MLAHEPFDRVLAALIAFGAQLIVDSRAPIRLPRFLEDLDDALKKLRSLLTACGWFSVEPLVIRLVADFQHSAKFPNAVLLPLSVNESVLYFRLFAKYAAAFFSISISSLSSLFSF